MTSTEAFYNSITVRPTHLPNLGMNIYAINRYCTYIQIYHTMFLKGKMPRIPDDRFP